MSPFNKKLKKSAHIQLVLITAVLASCHKPTPHHQRRVFMRSDTTAPYNGVRSYYGDDNGYNSNYNGYHSHSHLWYYAFRPYGHYYNGSYQRAGYYSGGLSEHANTGSNGFKGSISRGGFGSHGFSVSS